MTPEERIDLHQRIADSYRDSYLRQGVQDGEKYDAWKFAEGAEYCSPYFTGEEVIILNEAPDASAFATLEAKTYSLTFSDWKPASFESWAAVDGAVWKTRWEGTMEDGTKMGFYSYSFVRTNQDGEIVRWETHVNDEYSPFLDVAIGTHGPFSDHVQYFEAISRKLDKHGLSAEKILAGESGE